ncbi:hypothetical protein MAMP_02856 [Methylophaga aminisulfidivorans MP]|jgi:hypothetical protein|uniref:Uncharacterized protein n=1 Tax=Methylophaga aminisulfidivorans MP TaxID=1026882 RepID=F5SVI2_9GAMM|nr:hypothetical protein MAMP_02856 [Methylophaga aminisulfidivorans MP]
MTGFIINYQILFHHAEHAVLISLTVFGYNDEMPVITSVMLCFS